jgi:hypothetical protein
LHLPLVINDGNAGGVIPAIFEAAKPIQNQGDDFFRADISDDSTHGIISGGLGFARQKT